LDVYLERGTKRVFAGAPRWPGWARAARDEDGALEALVTAGPRFAAALAGTRLGFRAPRTVDELEIVARLEGTSTTDFGAPDVEAPGDREDVDERELRRLTAILRASWRAFDGAVEAALGVELATGPRGGGRTLEKIEAHVLDAEGGYLSRIGARAPDGDLENERIAVIQALERAVRDGVPPAPRGGKRWTPRYFVRRSAWHVLDHAWEIEDRIG
jgi:hypothetical protein